MGTSTRDTRVATDDYAYLWPGSEAEREALERLAAFEAERAAAADDGDVVRF